MSVNNIVEAGGASKGATGAFLTTTIDENLFVQGNSFSYTDYLTYGSSEVKTFVFDGTACECPQIVFENIIFSSNAGPLVIDFYAGVTLNATPGGTILGVSNRRATSANTTDSIYYLNPNIDNIGTRFSGDLVPANGQGQGNISGGSSSQGLPFEINKNVIYAYTVTNNNGAGTLAKIDSTWYEISTG